jgi:hypothetical protein
MQLRRCLVIGALVALVVGLGPAAWSQQVPQATCLDCHEGEGMEYAVVTSTPFIEIPAGNTTEYDVTVANPWLHDIASSLVTVNLTDAPGLSFDKPDDISRNESMEVPPGEARNVSFPVQAGATAVVATMTQTEDVSERGANDVDSRLVLPDGTVAGAGHDGIDSGDPAGLNLPEREPSKANTVERIIVRDDRLATTGGWNFTMERVGGDGTDPVEAQVDVYYNATPTQSQRITDTIGPNAADSATFDIKGSQEGEATITYTVTVTDYYEHPDGVQSQDEGNATLEGERTFTVGQTLETGDAGPAVPPEPPINWILNARIWGEATGFIGLFLIPFSLVLGGAFGRKNVLWMNKITQSARLRVLWHNALSFILLGVSIIHLILFLIEPVYSWSVGFVWGGTASLALVGLGITGAYQRRIAREIGYAKWRLLHIAMATTFVAATMAHVLIDGAHFDFLRNAIGLN